jgi:hypothetical protein
VVPNSTAPTAMVSEARLPWITRLKVSRPIWSVPKRFFPSGGLVMRRKSDFSGSYGAISGAASAMAMIATAMQPQNADSGARRKNLRRPPVIARRCDWLVGGAGRVGEVTVIGSGSSGPARRS